MGSARIATSVYGIIGANRENLMEPQPARCQPGVKVTVLEDSGDQRGSSFATGPAWLAFLGKIEEAHITTLLPGHVRGNHYHVQRREVIVVLYSDEWQLNWDRGAETAIERRQFSGAGAVLIEAERLATHAVANTGKLPLWIVALSNGVWDPASPDTHARKVFP
jgi:hypothetical protein